jgi:hypothetical protein
MRMSSVTRSGDILDAIHGSRWFEFGLLAGFLR